MKRFEEDRYYRPGDDAMRLIATANTLRQWRHEKRGPPYTRLGNSVLYWGRDLNAWLDSRRVETAAA